MAYIGNTPAENYASFLTETFTVSATTNYTLSHAVTNENDIRLVINGVVQQPGSGKAYTASGTTLTLSSATVSGDSMYAVYLGRALQTVNPPAASVGNSQLGSDAVTGAKIADDAISDEHLDPTVITGQTAETSIATDDLILLSDTSASGALKKMTRANFVSGIGGDNTPAFHAYVNSAQSIGTNSDIKIINFNEVVDTNSAFASNRFTVPSGEGGKYFIYACVSFSADVGYPHAEIFVNGSGGLNGESLTGNMGSTMRSCFTSRMLTLAASDYVELYTFQGSGATNTESSGRTFFGGYKLIGV
nr:c1q globular head like domain containing protein [uncultured Mediterranean phage uvMED]